MGSGLCGISTKNSKSTYVVIFTPMGTTTSGKPAPTLTQSIKCIYKVLLTSADVTKCCTETQVIPPNNKQCRCRSTVARNNSIERPEPRKKPREEPGYEGWPDLFWLCRVEIITEHGQDVQMFIDDQQGQIIIITVVVEGATGQQLRSKCQLDLHSRSFRVFLPLLLSLES